MKTVTLNIVIWLQKGSLNIELNLRNGSVKLKQLEKHMWLFETLIDEDIEQNLMKHWSTCLKAVYLH
jgi:hypothetical protein